MKLEDWQKPLFVNLKAPFLMIKAALPHLRTTHGSIINTGSIEGLAANPGHAAYCASKSGLHGLTRAVAVDHGKEGIRCNAVAPGWLDTAFNQNMIDSRSAPEKLPQRDRAHSSTAAHRVAGGGGRTRCLPCVSRCKFHHRPDFHGRWQASGVAKPSLTEGQLCPHCGPSSEPGGGLDSAQPGGESQARALSRHSPPRF